MLDSGAKGDQTTCQKDLKAARNCMLVCFELLPEAIIRNRASSTTTWHNYHGLQLHFKTLHHGKAYKRLALGIVKLKRGEELGT